MNEKEHYSGKGTQCFECGGYGHIRPECANYLRKYKKGLILTWSDSENEDEREITNNVMPYSRRCVSEGEISIREMCEE